MDENLCEECNRSTAQGSGLFVNRIVGLKTFICRECDENMEQVALEKETSEIAKSRYRQKTKALVAMGAESHTKVGKLAVSHSINNLVIGIEEFLDNPRADRGKRYKEYFRMLPVELIAVIISRSVINSISQEKKRASMAVQVGRAIEREVALQKFKETKNLQFKNLLVEHEELKGESKKSRQILKDARIKYGFSYSSWGVKTCAAVGLTGITIMARYTNMIQSYEKVEHGKKVGYVAPTEEMIDWLNKAHEHSAVSETLYRPMISPPRDWTDNFDGGYYLDQYQDKTLIDDRKNYYKNLKRDDCPILFDAVNHLQSCPWSVNNKVLNVIKSLWNRGVVVAGLPDPNMREEPKWVESYKENEELKRQYKADLYMTRTFNSRNVGMRYRLQALLEIAESYKKSVMYFPYSCDFRGRVYPIPKVLQPQGDDKAKGLLQFFEGKPIENKEQEDWFYIHGANCWGEDKLTFEDRIKWVRKNAQFIRECADNPLDFLRWAEADKPFQFLAWAFEFRQYQRLGSKFMSRIPVAMDGSNNGLQIMSLLLKDESLALQTNVLPSETPQDIYQTIADKLIERLQRDPNKENLNWLRYGVDRKLLKKAIMVVPYGGSFTTLLEIIQSHVYTKSLAEGKMPFKNLRKHCAVLTSNLWEIIKQELGSAMDLMKWLKSTIRPALHESIEPTFFSPSSLKVYQGYRNTRRHVVRTALGYKIKRSCNVMVDLDHLSFGKNCRSISPNFCHSLDASVMLYTVERMKGLGINALSMVHDSFATHAHSAPELSIQLRESVVEIFSDNLLEKFQQDIKSLVPDAEYPELPLMGDLDINLLHRSRYFFS